MSVPAHGTAFLKLTGTDDAPGTQLPGRSSASPALVRDGDRLTVFTRGTDGALRAQTARGGGWSKAATTDLGGPTHGRILGQPAAYASSGGRIDVFVRGTDDTAYRRVYADGRWGRWQSLGGALTDAPTAAFAAPDDWTLFARGADGSMWSRGPASGWTSLGAPQDRPFSGRPSSVVDDAGRLHVAVRTADDAVWWRTRDTSGTWSSWTALGGTTSGSPTLVASGGTVHLYARAGDYTLWQRSWTAADGWASWTPQNDFVSGAFDGALGAVAGPDGGVLAAFRGVDGRVHQSEL